MADLSDKIREPDERTGPAILGRKPMLFPDEREEIAANIRRKMNDVRE